MPHCRVCEDHFSRARSFVFIHLVALFLRSAPFCGADVATSRRAVWVPRRSAATSPLGTALPGSRIGLKASPGGARDSSPAPTPWGEGPDDKDSSRKTCEGRRTGPLGEGRSTLSRSRLKGFLLAHGGVASGYSCPASRGLPRPRTSSVGAGKPPLKPTVRSLLKAESGPLRASFRTIPFPLYPHQMRTWRTVRTVRRIISTALL